MITKRKYGGDGVESVTFKVEDMSSEYDKLKVINAMRKYSGVLDVGVDMNTGRVRVEYDPDNITAEDMKKDIEKANYRVDVVRK